MSATPDRFDRMLLGIASPGSLAVARVTVPPPPRPAERQPVITSTRGSRFVDHTSCQYCGTDRMGIEFHGVLMSGAKVHQLVAHSPGVRRVARGQPRCLGAGMRLVFEGGVWRGLQPVAVP
jgi:hypothetical protein